MDQKKCQRAGGFGKFNLEHLAAALPDAELIFSLGRSHVDCACLPSQRPGNIHFNRSDQSGADCYRRGCHPSSGGSDYYR
jgi:hypothetical protein